MIGRLAEVQQEAVYVPLPEGDHNCLGAGGKTRLLAVALADTFEGEDGGRGGQSVADDGVFGCVRLPECHPLRQR